MVLSCDSMRYLSSLFSNSNCPIYSLSDNLERSNFGCDGGISSSFRDLVVRSL